MDTSTSTDERKILRSLMPYLGEKGLSAFANYIDSRLTMNNQTLLKKLVTKEDLLGVRQDITNMKGNIFRLETDVAGLKTDVTGLKTDVAGLKTDVAGLKTDVAELKTDVTGLKEAVTDLRVELPNLETKMEVKLSDGKFEILRWMLTLFIVTMLAVIGLYFK